MLADPPRVELTTATFSRGRPAPSPKRPPLPCWPNTKSKAAHFSLTG